MVFDDRLYIYILYESDIARLLGLVTGDCTARKGSTNPSQAFNQAALTWNLVLMSWSDETNRDRQRFELTVIRTE